MHPLDPLSASEIEHVTAICRMDKRLPTSCKFVTICLLEPEKPHDLIFRDTEKLERQAFATLYSPQTKLIYETRVSLDTQSVIEIDPIADRYPAAFTEDYDRAEEVVRSDARWRAAMGLRGVTDFSLAIIDGWPPTPNVQAGAPRPAQRILHMFTFMHESPADNGYARPVEGLIVTVDVDAMLVNDVVDHGTIPLPPMAGDYSGPNQFNPRNRPSFSRVRTDLKPIEITQPEGPSYVVDGWAVHWQKWSFRVGFTPREGLVLHQISYRDRGRSRPIVYRASLAEMVVPYGDASPAHWGRNVFDEGEVGLGLLTNSLRLGCDCLGQIHYFDAAVSTSDGQSVIIPNAICMHEEDCGLAWKHTDLRTGQVETRRSRRLVISAIATVGNYDYGFFWYFYTDGSLEFDVKLTGIITAGAVQPGKEPRHGVTVAPSVYGPHHQHFFNVRLDMTVDGPHNSVYEIDSVPEDPQRNPHGNAWRVVRTLLPREKSGTRNLNAATARHWQIANPSTPNELGQPVSYSLMPGTSAPPLMQPGSRIYDRARFIQHELWVTAYDPEERFAAGDYPYQSPDVQGLPVYIQDDAPIADADIVLWYTVGVHHIARAEDWPVMPVVHAGFLLRPTGFFDGNPALDLPG